jgi:dihydrofolate synthase/folylpolyglutamate synthase
VSARAFLHSLEQTGIKLGLDQIRGLLDALGRPDRAYPSILVAGTNGKGSVSAMVECGLRAAGYRTGRYTSPHLTHLEERFAIDGTPIAPALTDAIGARVERASRHLPVPPSFFEGTTALALDVFRHEAVDVAVLEVGLGGRLDATNAVDPVAVALTAIDFDHEEWLGSTLAAIAREKAGVIKPGVFAVLGANPPEVEAVVDTACRDAGVSLIRAAEVSTDEIVLEEGHARVTARTPLAEYRELRLALAGRHQVANAVVAIRLLEELAQRGLMAVPVAAIRAAVETVVWPGRLERLRGRDVDVLVDGAHNPAGARALARFIEEVFARPLPMVVGIMADKPIDDILRVLASAASHLACTAPATPRAASPKDLAAAARRLAPDRPVSSHDRPGEAVRAASAFGAPVVVAGSLYLAGEVREEFS